MGQTIACFDLSVVRGIHLDGTACKRGHFYVRVFIGMARGKDPMLFLTPGCVKNTLRLPAAFVTEHGPNPGRPRDGL